MKRNSVFHCGDIKKLGVALLMDASIRVASFITSQTNTHDGIKI